MHGFSRFWWHQFFIFVPSRRPALKDFDAALQAASQAVALENLDEKGDDCWSDLFQKSEALPMTDPCKNCIFTYMDS